MAQTAKKRSGLRGFIILVIIAAVLGGTLWSQGDLISPVETTTMLVNLSASGDAGFAMVGERGAPPDMVASTDTETTVAADTSADTEVQAEANTTVAAAEASTESTSTTGLTMDEFVAQLAAAGVDVDAVTASMTAEGRSLDNLLAVVNSGRTTVADLAVRLSGQTVVRDTGSTEDTTVTAPDGGEAGSTSLFDLRWDEIGSVAYNLWFILAVTILVIVFGRPVGWVINRLKRTPARA